MLVLDDNMLQVPDEIKSYVVNVLCVWEPCRILSRKNLILSLYICSGYLSKLTLSSSRSNLSCLHFSDAIIVLETAFYYYTCPHMLILCIHVRFLYNFYDLI